MSERYIADAEPIHYCLDDVGLDTSDSQLLDNFAGNVPSRRTSLANASDDVVVQRIMGNTTALAESQPTPIRLG